MSMRRRTFIGYYLCVFTRRAGKYKVNLQELIDEAFDTPECNKFIIPEINSALNQYQLLIPQFINQSVLLVDEATGVGEFAIPGPDNSDPDWKAIARTLDRHNIEYQSRFGVVNFYT